MIKEERWIMNIFNRLLRDNGRDGQRDAHVESERKRISKDSICISKLLEKSPFWGFSTLAVLVEIKTIGLL